MPPNTLPLKIDGFIVNVNGLIESGFFYSGNGIFCKYDILFGPNWKLLSGQLSGQSQHACEGEGTMSYFVWNFPFEVSLTSEIPTGWPQVVISCFSPDFFGREVLKAYGVVHIPTLPGTHTRTLQMFAPISSNVVADLIGIFQGQKAEIINAPRVLASGVGREIIKTQSEGTMKIKFDVKLINMEERGFNV